MASLKALRGAFDLSLSELIGIDLLLGVVGGTLGGIAAAKWPHTAISTAPWAAAVVTAIIGTVIAGLTVHIALMDQPFLRKLRAINVDPVRLLVPLMWTAALGVVSLLPLVVLANLSETAGRGWLCPFGIAAGFLAFWCVASVLNDLDTLVQTIGLKMDALDVPDDIDTQTQRFKDGRTGTGN
jgi:hypothetical protein